MTRVLHCFSSQVDRKTKQKRITFRDSCFFRGQPELSVKRSYWNYYWKLLWEKERNWRKLLPHGGVHSCFIGLYNNHSCFHSDIHLWLSSCLSNSNEIGACSFHCRNGAVNLTAHQSSQQNIASALSRWIMIWKWVFKTEGCRVIFKGSRKLTNSSMEVVNTFMYKY